jgi:hypothetical protein
MFHSRIQNDHEAIAKEEAGYKPIPVVKQVSEEMVTETYYQIKADIAELFRTELAELKEQPEEAAAPEQPAGNKPANGRWEKKRAKKVRQQQTAALRNVKKDQSDTKANERNGASRSPVKNDDTEQVL